MDFSTAQTASVAYTGLVPFGTLAWVKLEVEPGVFQGKSNEYVKVKLVIDGGDYSGKWIRNNMFTSGLDRNGAPLTTWTESSIKSILEAVRGAHPQRNVAGYRMAGNTLADCVAELNGMRAGIKIGLEKDGVNNKVHTWLSPVATPGLWSALCEGRTAPTGPAPVPKAAAQGAPAASARPAIISTSTDPDEDPFA